MEGQPNSSSPYHAMIPYGSSPSQSSPHSAHSQTRQQKRTSRHTTGSFSEMLVLKSSQSFTPPTLHGIDERPLLRHEAHENQVEAGGLKSMPPAIWYIVFNETCERFTYYGLTGILALFLSNHLGYNDSISSAIVLYFQAVVYFSPLIGG
eukprot:TRINITY_DN13477_c0_g1_i1.p1 TRINITY_DN13477_c0_g1~~TRINITY_DN13477_c0_g1_i1.p1  ORF type:complete len:150 (+),score=7.32 TRINITY_DN13477_c0_g1_i1:414-863(+)